MIELRLDSMTERIKLSSKDLQSFQKPLVFYLLNQNDVRRFFITFVIINFSKKEMIYLFSYNEENIKTISEQPENEKYSAKTLPHSTISINSGEDFLTFIEEEEYFLYVNYKKMIMKVYTMDDLISKSEYTFQKFSSTFYIDDCDPKFFYISVVDTSKILHIYRVSLALDNIQEIDFYPSHSIPPHTLRKYKNFFLLSHDFKSTKYELSKTRQLVDMQQLSGIINKNALRFIGKENVISNNIQGTGIKLLTYKKYKKFLDMFREKYAIKCMHGEILLIDIISKEKTIYNTMGGNPAHFEIDTKNDIIYTSSHNFFLGKEGYIFLEPSVIDKYKLNKDKLEHIGSFSYEKGYRYTSHKIFYYKDKPFICTFGQPNRLIFIDATNMKLLFYHDIGKDLLTNQPDISTYISYYHMKKPDFVSIEVSQDGENIIFIGQEFIYFYNFPQRKIYKKINYKLPTCLESFKIACSHIHFLD